MGGNFRWLTPPCSVVEGGGGVGAVVKTSVMTLLPNGTLGTGSSPDAIKQRRLAPLGHAGRHSRCADPPHWCSFNPTQIGNDIPLSPA